jgi:ribosome-associated protein
VHLRPGPGIPGGLSIPESDLQEQFSKSSGPGGQSVNTTDSRVEVTLDLTASTVLDDDQRTRAIDRLGTDRITITASEHRSQHRNRVAARERLAAALRTALAPPPPSRVPTKPSKSSRRRRVETKRKRGKTKALRGRVRGE